jgi:segregation and condensation protein B
VSETDNLREEQLMAAVGAILFASGEPVQPKEIASALKDVKLADVQKAIDGLDRHYATDEAGLRLERVAGGVRLSTRPEVAEWVRQFFRERHRARLSHAALETLAIVAYRQPVTAAEIQAIRGKDPQGPLKNLVEKKLLRILGKKKVIGNPQLYGTSKHFLVHFGLDSLGDLPSMDEFDAFVGGLGTVEVVDDPADPAEPPAQPDAVLPEEGSAPVEPGETAPGA